MLGNARVTKLTGLIALMILMACGAVRAQDGRLQCNCFVLPSGANALPQDDPFWDEIGHYFQRIDTSSVVSGDAREVNAVTQIIDPWPPYARNRRIPANGQRMVGAIDRYQNAKRLGARAPTLAPIITQSLTGSGGGEDAGSGGMGGGGGGY
jgi:hypothetical protein